MAREIRFSYQFEVNNGSYHYGGREISQLITQTLIGGNVPGKLSIPTAPTAISLSQLTNAGLCEFTNLETVNSVDIALTLRLKAGESYVLRLKPGASVTATAVTATSNINVSCMED